MKINTKNWRGSVVTVVIALEVLTSAGAFAGVVPRDLNKYGNTYGEWSARWWQWALSIPADVNPILDTTGTNCKVAQTGSVWFLAGTAATTETRSCTVPVGKALFFPILNSMFGQGVGDCTGPSDCNTIKLRKAAAEGENNPVTLEAQIDGVAVANLKTFRVTSPVFEFFAPANAVFGISAGTHGPEVADGYWLLLDPLPKGAHTIHFKGIAVGGSSTVEVTYNLTVN
jgi:hypothetical protein